MEYPGLTVSNFMECSNSPKRITHFFTIPDDGLSDVGFTVRDADWDDRSTQNTHEIYRTTHNSYCYYPNWVDAF